jgi:hypothetical protein
MIGRNGRAIPGRSRALDHVPRKSNAYVRSAIREPLLNKPIGQTLQIRASLRHGRLPVGTDIAFSRERHQVHLLAA